MHKMLRQTMIVIVLLGLSCAGADSTQVVTLARVIFAETSGVSLSERAAVAEVIRNRVGHPGFSSLKAAYQVATCPGQFSGYCSGNHGWKLSSDLKKVGEWPEVDRRAWEDSLTLARELMEGKAKPDHGGPVYFHDNGVSKPAKWDNKHWRAVETRKSEHFTFYRVEKVEKKEKEK